MSGLPKYPDNWLTVSLSEVIQIQKGKKPFNLGLRDDARTVPYINIAAFETKKIAEYAPKQDAPECSPSDTLLVWDGARAGLSGRGVAGYIGSTLARITSDLATPDFLFHFINSKYDELNSRTKGVGIPHIDPTVLKEIEFPLAPFKEQTRIVQKLEELLSDLDAGVAELKAAQKKLAQYRQSLLKAAVEGKLTQHWREQHRAPSPSPQPLSHQGTGALGVDGVNDVAANYQLPLSDKKTSTREQNPELPNTPQSATLPSPLVGEGPGEREQAAFETGAQLLERILKQRRAHWEAKQLAKFQQQGKTPPKGWQDKYPEPVKPDTSELPELPEGWVWASLDMLGEIASGVAKGTKRNPDIPVREVPYLRVANVQRGFLDLSEIKSILATEPDIAELTLQPGDILFNEGGDRDKLGRGWIWRGEVSNCIHQNHVFRMRPFLAEIVPELISHHGNTFGKTWFQNAGKQTTNLASINMTMLRLFPVPLGPALEQQEILSVLQLQLDNLDQQEKSVMLGLKQSAAQRKNILKAAFSGLLVPQDPNDEPASALLERIRNERQHAKIPAKRSRRRAGEEISR